jgi:hypothetical protein
MRWAEVKRARSGYEAVWRAAGEDWVGCVWAGQAKDGRFRSMSVPMN